MTRKTRRRLFILLVFVFFVIGTSAALYAQGYRVDLTDMSLQKVGGIYVRSYPRAAVYLDGKLIKENFWFFQNGVLINDLFPREYEVLIINENYEEWRQTIEVEPSLVSEVKFAVLVPKTRTVLSFATSVVDFWVGEEGLILNSSGVLRLGDATIFGNKVTDQDHESNRILSVDARKNFYIYGYASKTFTNVTAFLGNVGLPSFPNISLDIGNPDLILSNQSQIYLINIPTQRSMEIASLGTSTVQISPIAVSRDFLAWTQFDKNKNSSALVVYNKSRRTKTIHPSSFSGRTIQIEFRGDRLGFLQNEGSFYFGNPFSNSVDKLASDVLEFKFVEDNSRIAVRGKRVLEFIPLRNLDSEKYLKFELPNPGDIQKMQWYKDGRHIFLSYLDKTMFLDIDDKFLEHYAEIGSGNAHYDAKTNQLYSLKDGVITRVDFVE